MASPPRPERAHFARFTRLAVRWGDMDVLGHVNNAKFLTYDEQARLEYFAAFEAVVPGLWKAEGLILARMACDFLVQVHHPATLDVGIRIRRIGRSSMETEGGLFAGEQLVAATQGVVVWFDYVAQKPAPVPEAVRALIRSIEPIPPLES
jgi:acyl-CoA thioester hydrolase